jgi:hypothetical protein
MLASVSRANAVFGQFFVNHPTMDIVSVTKGCVALNAKTVIINDFPPHIIITADSFSRNIWRTLGHHCPWPHDISSAGQLTDLKFASFSVGAIFHVQKPLDISRWQTTNIAKSDMTNDTVAGGSIVWS